MYKKWNTYTEAHYLQKRAQKDERFAQARIKIPTKTFLDVKASYPSDDDFKYALRRLKEFLVNLAEMLYIRLQPGFIKTGKSLDFGCIPFLLFDYWFGTVNKCARKMMVRSISVDGEDMPDRKFYYTFENTMPNLGKTARSDWALRFHGDGNGSWVTNKKSQYESLKLICEERTGRVYLTYKQATYGEAGVNEEGEPLWYRTT